MELEYNEELDEYFITLPENILNNMGWEEGDMLEYEFDMNDDRITIFRI